MMSSCFFYQEDKCMFRDMMKSTKKDCPFMDENRKCTASEGDLVDYDFNFQEINKE